MSPHADPGKHGENAVFGAACQQIAIDFAPDLQAVVDAWDSLPEAIRAGIVAMVQAAGG